MKIKILSGPVHSGKTTYLSAICSTDKKMAGILSPVINTKRHFQDIQTGETFLMEADENETGVLKIGRYTFSAAAFQRASKIIEESIVKSYDSIVMDEIGPLELQGEGFAATLTHLLKSSRVKILWLVIRESKVDETCQLFNITNAEIIRVPEI